MTVYSFRSRGVNSFYHKVVLPVGGTYNENYFRYLN